MDLFEEFQKSDATYKLKQKDNFDKRHRTKDLPMIPDDTPVWVDSDNGPVSGRVVTSAGTPRSYLVDSFRSTSEEQNPIKNCSSRI